MAGAGLTAAQEKKLREGGINEVKAAAAADVAAAEAAPSPAPAKAPKDPRACECGCGENTKGGRYRPGHDAKHHARLKAEEKAKAEAAPVPGQTGIDGAEVTADGGEI